jgi:hypothetical protein
LFNLIIARLRLCLLLALDLDLLASNLALLLSLHCRTLDLHLNHALSLWHFNDIDHVYNTIYHHEHNPKPPASIGMAHYKTPCSRLACCFYLH